MSLTERNKKFLDFWNESDLGLHEFILAEDDNVKKRLAELRR